MPAVVAPTKRILAQHRPRYSSAQRLISSSEFESFYAPEAVLPDEIDVNLFTYYIQFELRYTPQETASRKVASPNGTTYLFVGKHTQKIQAIRVNFEEKSIESLLKNLESCAAAIKRLKGDMHREVMQKSYEVVRQIVLDIKARIQDEADSIQVSFQTAE